MFKFFDGVKIDQEVLRADIEKEEARKAVLKQRVEEERKKMRLNTVVGEYTEKIEKAKQEGHIKDQEFLEKALQELKEQIQKDQEKK